MLYVYGSVSDHINVSEPRCGRLYVCIDRIFIIIIICNISCRMLYGVRCTVYAAGCTLPHNTDFSNVPALLYICCEVLSEPLKVYLN